MALITECRSPKCLLHFILSFSSYHAGVMPEIDVFSALQSPNRQLCIASSLWVGGVLPWNWTVRRTWVWDWTACCRVKQNIYDGADCSTGPVCIYLMQVVLGCLLSPDCTSALSICCTFGPLQRQHLSSSLLHCTGLQWGWLCWTQNGSAVMTGKVLAQGVSCGAAWWKGSLELETEGRAYKKNPDLAAFKVRGGASNWNSTW